MPGLCGYLRFESDSDDGSALERMLSAMTHHDWYRRESTAVDADGIGLGRVSLGFVNTAPQPVSLDGDAFLAVLDGELLNARELAADLRQSGHACRGDSHAEIALRGYLRDGARFFERARGKFTAAIWDRERGEFALVTDRFGMKPLYYGEGPEHFLFASELKALFAFEQGSRAQDPRGIIQFFTFGQLWGEQTLYKDMAVVPAGSVLRRRREDRRSSVETYAELPRPVAGRSTPEVLESIDEAFAKAVDESVRDTPHLGIALSGGMDARTLLAVMDTQQQPATALCMGMPGSRDQRSARQMARLKGCDYHDFMLDGAFLSQFEHHLDRMVHLTDGHYLSQCIVMPTFAKYRELGIQVLLRGHAGELMHMRKAYSFSLDAQAFAMRTEADLHAWLFEHLRAYMLDALDEPLFEFADRAECDAVARETLSTALAKSNGWDRPLDRIWQIFITERLRRETAMSLVKFGSVVETRLPYLDPHLLEALAHAPAELKQDEEIQTHILRKRYPQFLGITNVNTGAKVGASSPAKKFHSLKMRVFAKLGLPGYQPYERLGLWLRRELQPLVERTLLSEQCLQRGVFRPDAVRTVVREHSQGTKNHTFLIMAMMIFERGRQKFIETASAPAEEHAGAR